MRAGAYALSLLSIPLNVQVLEALEDEPLSLIDLRRAVGSPPQTTMRGHLRSLCEVGVLDRRRNPGFPGSVEYQLGPASPGLRDVADVLMAWLAEAPDGPLQLGTDAAKSQIKALIEGWSTGIVRALAARPLTLTDLNRLIATVNYPSLERRLATMRLGGQLKVQAVAGRGRPYAVTDWLRHSVAPVSSAVRWERQYARDRVEPVGRIHMEAGFLLAVPMLRLSESISGSCRLVVQLGGDDGRLSVAGVLAVLDHGAVVSCTSRLEGKANAWASGSVAGWLSALVDGDASALETEGDAGLARALTDSLHSELFRTRIAV